MATVRPYPAPLRDTTNQSDGSVGIVGKTLGLMGIDLEGRRAATSWDDALSNTIDPRPYYGTGSILPIYASEDGSGGLAVPSMISAPVEGFNRMWERGDEANITNPEALAQSSQESFDAAGLAATGGLAAGVAGVGERAGVSLGDHAIARYLDWKHPEEILPERAQFPRQQHTYRGEMDADLPYANDFDEWDAITGSNNELRSLRQQMETLKKEKRSMFPVIDGDLQSGGFGLGQKFRNMMMGGSDGAAGAVPEGAVAANGIGARIKGWLGKEHDYFGSEPPQSLSMSRSDPAGTLSTTMDFGKPHQQATTRPVVSDPPHMAAIRVGDRIFTGSNHGEALLKAEEAVGPEAVAKGWAGQMGDDEGFVTKSGRYLTRFEAKQAIDPAFKPDFENPNGLHSSDVYDFKHSLYSNSPTGVSVPLAFNDYEDEQPQNAMMRRGGF